MIDLRQVLTFTEAATKWGLASGNTLRQAAARGRFEEGEVRKSGTVWLTTYEAMTRVFGPLLNSETAVVVLDQGAIFQALLTAESSPERLKQIKKEATAIFDRGQQLQISETLFGKTFLLYWFTRVEEWERWLLHTQRSLIPRK